MSVFAVEQFLFDLGQDQTLRVEFVHDRKKTIAGYDMDPEEARAVQAIDLKWLFAQGVNPLLLLRFNLTGLIPGRDAYLKLLCDGAPTDLI